MTGDQEQLGTMAWGYKSDMEIADMVRMLMRNDLNHEGVCTASRDRIMYLSQQVAKWQDIAIEAASLSTKQEACTMVDAELEKERAERAAFQQKAKYDSGRIPKGKEHIKIRHVLQSRHVELILLDDMRRTIKAKHVNVSSDHTIRVKLDKPVVGLWIVKVKESEDGS